MLGLIRKINLSRLFIYQIFIYWGFNRITFIFTFGCLFQNATSLTKEDKFCHLKYLLKRLLPFVSKFNEQQNSEREMEAKIQGTNNWLKKLAVLINLVKHLYHYCGLSEYLVWENFLEFPVYVHGWFFLFLLYII